VNRSGEVRIWNANPLPLHLPYRDRKASFHCVRRVSREEGGPGFAKLSPCQDIRWKRLFPRLPFPFVVTAVLPPVQKACVSESFSLSL
jgi:hypothetical protein